MGRAGAAAGHAEAELIEAQHHGLALPLVGQHVHDVGEEVAAARVHLHRSLEAAQGPEGPVEPIAQGPQARRFVLLAPLGRLAGRREADDAGHVLGAAAPAALLTAAEEEWGKGGAGLQVQGAHPLRAADLVGREGGGVHGQGLQVERHLPQGLHGVGVEEGAGPVGQGRQLGDGLDGAHLRVGRLHRHEHSVGSEGLFQDAGFDEALAVGAQVGDAHALGL